MVFLIVLQEERHSMKNDEIKDVNPLSGETVYSYEKEKEDAYLIYKDQIDSLLEKNIISFELAQVSLTIIRHKLGLPFLCIYPVHYELDIITLKSD